MRIFNRRRKNFQCMTATLIVDNSKGTNWIKIMSWNYVCYWPVCGCVLLNKDVNCLCVCDVLSLYGEEIESHVQVHRVMTWARSLNEDYLNVRKSVVYELSNLIFFLLVTLTDENIFRFLLSSQSQTMLNGI